MYENEGLKEGSIPTVTPIDKVLDEGNCGEVTDRGKEACECVVKPANNMRRRPHSHQSCEVTNRNSIQGRWGSVSGPTITKPSSFVRIGKSRACAAKVNRLIQGELESRSGNRLQAESRSPGTDAKRWSVKAIWRFQQSAEAIVRIRHTPLAIGRAEP